MKHKVSLFGQGFDSPRLHHKRTMIAVLGREVRAESSVFMMGTLWIRQAN